MDVNALKTLISEAIDQWAAGVSPTTPGEVTEVKNDARVLPEGKRAVRTKSSGDRVYYLDEDKKTRQWVTTSENLSALGFEMEDVVEVPDSELMKYNMSSAIYKVDAAS